MLHAWFIIIAYVAFCGLCWYRFRIRQRHLQVPSPSDADLLIAYASQSGQAAELATTTARQLHGGKIRARVIPINQIKDHNLKQSKRILFIVSTYGEGEPPDMAAPFARRHLNSGGRDLSHLSYGVLALGDRQYQHFCRFGHQLNQGLQSQAAQPLFELIEMDRQDPAALTLWQQRLTKLGGAASAPADLRPTFVNGTLRHRRCLNPGSAGAPAYALSLQTSTSLTWQAGDIACIAPGNALERLLEFMQALHLDGSLWIDASDHSAPSSTLQEVLTYRRLPPPGPDRDALADLPVAQLLKQLPPLPTRDYSIASIPSDDHIELLVRQVRQPDGALGLGSGWLSCHAQLHTPLRLHVRSNPAFHAPAPDAPLILIGNGTGMAGLRAHLRARLELGAHNNWLLFGERNRTQDLFYEKDLLQWQADGHLQRLDLAFSRDDGPYRYVQDLIAPAATDLQQWLSEGAVIYVCGSIAGMATGVEQALTAHIGEAALDELKEQGRYRRDVY